ncbi:DUF1415 domain-containing protein [Vibrio zhugei]|uniref:DUF1415 domain-containing protein n=1 Tax=Vibrio zhugei TaxID=2479546 RepID=A0ABV7CDH4_9VIBR|nr:DUF1415 domain-containing protein [Vibrio zhugei]
MNTLQRIDSISQQVNQWLDDVVIGLNLCPFAAKPQRNQQIKIHVSLATSEEVLLSDIEQCLRELDAKSAEDLETTLLVVPDMLHHFFDYNFFIDWIDALIRQENWEGTYQVATFHPDYCFADCDPEDPANLTNRAPYPIYHLIREDSMEKVLKHYPDPEAIPDNNIQRVTNLTTSEKHRLFPYLYRRS